MFELRSEEKRDALRLSWEFGVTFERGDEPSERRSRRDARAGLEGRGAVVGTGRDLEGSGEDAGASENPKRDLRLRFLGRAA